MGFVEAKVVGTRELRRQLKAAGADLNDLKDANKRVGDIIVTAAKARAPHRTGTLAGTIRSNRAAASIRIRAGGARVQYAQPIHWGWPRRNWRQNAFISDAATATEHRWVEVYFEELQAVIDKVGSAQ